MLVFPATGSSTDASCLIQSQVWSAATWHGYINTTQFYLQQSQLTSPLSKLSGSFPKSIFAVWVFTFSSLSFFPTSSIWFTFALTCSKPLWNLHWGGKKECTKWHASLFAVVILGRPSTAKVAFAIWREQRLCCPSWTGRVNTDARKVNHRGK